MEILNDKMLTECSQTKSDDNKVKMLRDDLNSRVEFLQNIDKKYEDCGDVCDVVVFHDGDHWRYV